MKSQLFILLLAAFTEFSFEQYTYETSPASISYHIHPRSFKDSDGDGNGDIQGIIEKLDHLQKLNATKIYLSPIFLDRKAENRTVDPIFGTDDDLEELIAKAEDLGIKFITDESLLNYHKLYDPFLNIEKDIAALLDPYYFRNPWKLFSNNSSRIASRFGESHYESMTIIAMTQIDEYLIYYGDEIAMTDNREFSTEDPTDQFCTPFQWDNSTNAGFSNTTGQTWLPIPEHYRTVNLKAQQEAGMSTYKLYQDQIKMRKQRKNPEYYKWDKPVRLGKSVLAYVQPDVEHAYAILANFGNATKIDLNELWTGNGEALAKHAKSKVLMAKSKSKYAIGSTILDYKNIELLDFETIVLEVNSAKKSAVSLILFVIIVAKLFSNPFQ